MKFKIDEEDILAEKTEPETLPSEGQTEKASAAIQIPAKSPAPVAKAAAKKARFNLALSEENYEYIKRQSRFYGMTATDFVNRIIEDRIKADPKKYASF